MASLPQVSLNFFTTPEFQTFVNNYKKTFKTPTTVKGIRKWIVENSKTVQEKMKILIGKRKSKVSVGLFEFDRQVLKNIIKAEVKVAFETNENFDDSNLSHKNKMKAKAANANKRNDPYDSFLEELLKENTSQIDAVTFWMSPPTTLIPFQEWALSILATPASSAASERTFSVTSMITEKRKNRTLEELLNAKLVTTRNSRKIADIL